MVPVKATARVDSVNSCCDRFFNIRKLDDRATERDHQHHRHRAFTAGRCGGATHDAKRQCDDRAHPTNKRRESARSFTQRKPFYKRFIIFLSR